MHNSGWGISSIPCSTECHGCRGDSHHRLKEQNELPSVKHCVMHIWPFWSNTSRKWVRPACGISGWEWNKLGQTASGSGSAGPRRLTRSLHIVLFTPPASEKAPWAQQEGTKLLWVSGKPRLLHFHGSLAGQQGWAWAQQCFISTGSMSDRSSLWKDLCTAPPNASVILGFSAAKILQSSLSRERQGTYY